MNTKFLETTEYTDYTEKTINASQTSDMVLIVLCQLGILSEEASSCPPSARRLFMPLRGAMAASQS